MLLKPPACLDFLREQALCFQYRCTPSLTIRVTVSRDFRCFPCDSQSTELREASCLAPRFRKSLVLFNLCRAIHHGKRVVIVEGFFDCFKVYQAGIPCVVALMGCSLSCRQTDLLEQHFEETVLLLDGDKAGRAASTTIAAQLVPKLSTKLVQVPEGSQPDQLSEDQIRCLCIPSYF